MDGFVPVLGKFYYSCVLIEKHLRTIKARGGTPYMDHMLQISKTRWKRWHRPILTFAYACDPCYQQHDLSPISLKIEFDKWRSKSAESIFSPEEWDAADHHLGWQWWHSFGDAFPLLQKAAVEVLSKPIAASACEFNRSDCGQRLTKKRASMHTETFDMIINTRAMLRLQKSVQSTLLHPKLPTLDDILDTMVNEAIAATPGACDDPDDDNYSVDSDSSDDSGYSVCAGDAGDTLYELGHRMND